MFRFIFEAVSVVKPKLNCGRNRQGRHFNIITSE